MEQRTPIARNYRWFVFVITLGYFFYQFVATDLSIFGWQFRFLTNWALAASTLSAWFMLSLSMGWSDKRREVCASVTLVVNATVVLMYWKIYLQDPSLFYGDGDSAVWFQEYFIHGLGPLLQAIDALFILGVFNRIGRVVPGVIAVPILYVAWIEGVLRPINETPVGSVTTGLPYLFLNDMEPAGRITFYITTTVTMVVLMLIAWGLSALLRRLRLSPPAAPQSP